MHKQLPSEVIKILLLAFIASIARKSKRSWGQEEQRSLVNCLRRGRKAVKKAALEDTIDMRVTEGYDFMLVHKMMPL